MLQKSPALSAVLALALLLLGALFPTLSSAQAPKDSQGFSKGSLPDWVRLHPIAAFDADYAKGASGGSFYLLLDDQYRLDGQEMQQFTREVARITDRTGVEALASISRDFDPANEELILTRLAVIRDGVESDRMGGVRSDVLRREESLEDGIVTGVLTVTLDIPDIRVGDTLDIGFLRRIKPAVKGAPFAAFLYADFFEPVAEARTSVLAPADLALAMWPPQSQGPEPQISEKDGWRLTDWVVIAPQPLPSEEASPSLRDGRRMIGFSQSPDWSQLSAALGPHYTADWTKRLEQARAETPDPADLALRVLRMVQQDVRYLSLSIGEGGYLARSPAEVLQTGYGDCKDKSLLLRASLRHLGIEADVALTDLDEGHSLPLWPPAIWAFDHMILRARVDGRDMWMDATAIAEAGDKDHYATPDYGYALPIGAAPQDQLVPITLTDKDSWRSAVTETYAFSDEGVTLQVETILNGPAADSRRYRLASDGISQTSRDFTEYYAQTYPGIEAVTELVVEDDLAANRLRMVESYRVPTSALQDEGLVEDFPFAADDLTPDLPNRQSGPRLTPMWVGAPLDHSFQILVSGAPIDFEAPEDLAIENPAFDYRFRAIAPIKGSMALNWTFRTLAREVPAETVKDIMRDLRKLEDNASFSWNLLPEDQ